MSESPRAWWARNRSHSRRTAVGAGALVAVLLAVCGFVWASPESDDSPTASTAQSKALDAVTGPRGASGGAAERERMAARIATLAHQLAVARRDVASLKTASASNAKSASTRLAAAQQRATAAQNALAALSASAPSPASALGASGGASSAARKTSATAGSSTASGVASRSSKAQAPTTTTDPETGTNVTAPSVASLLHPSQRYYGMYTDQAPFNWATYDATAAKVGETPDMVGYFSGFDQDYRANAVTRAWARNTMPLMTWESRPIGQGNDVVDDPDYTLSKIYGGQYDDYLHRFAKSVVATGLPVAIRLDQEMNGVWYPWAETDGQGNSINGNSPKDYVKMWQYVHDVFQQEGANDLVIWVWSPNIVNNLPKTHQSEAYTNSLYPGDAYVDWVGLSAYLRPPYKDDQTPTFAYTFDSSLAQLRDIAPGKPILLAEIGASETGGMKPAWITSFFQAMADPANSDVIGFAWFDLAVTTYVEGERSTNDWRVDSRADSLAAFVKGLTDPAGDFDLRPVAPADAATSG